MIAQFPYFYHDELVYSLIARYYQRSGYMRYIFAAEDLFQAKTVKPDIEFINLYTPAALKMITREMTMEQVIEKHTMFPYYGRFLPLERRQKGFKALITMDANCRNLLAIPKRKSPCNRYLRYCPECAMQDRKQHGETYWHRIHQMTEVNICPVHKCFLIDSNVIISGKASPDLVVAEMVIPEQTEVHFCDNEIQNKLSEYMAEVFEKPVSIECGTAIGQFLHSKMENTPYRSIRGEQRNITLFHTDFVNHYKNLPHNDFTEIWKIQKVLNGYKHNHYEICMLAMFLNIPAADLIDMELPEQTQEQKFDEEIFRLHEQGLKYPEIAKRLNASYDTVKAIGERRYKTYRKEPVKPFKGGVKAFDWQQIDRDTLPLVKDAIRQLKGDGKSRPKKVTVFAVERLLNLPNKRITLYLPMCKSEIDKYQETQEQYWSREIIWAVNTIFSCGLPMNWKHIRNLTNMRKRDIIRCMSELQKIADNEMVEMIQNLL